MVIERKFSILKDSWPDPEQIIHQVGMHFRLFHKLRFVAKTASYTMVIGLAEQLGIPVPCDLVKKGEDIRPPFFQLLDKRPGKRECTVESFVKFFQDNISCRHIAFICHSFQHFFVNSIKVERIEIFFFFLWIRGKKPVQPKWLVHLKPHA